MARRTTEGGGLDSESRQVVTDALSSALVATGEAEFDRLRAGMSQDEAADHVTRALEDLQSLQHGTMPNYHDPWVALLYVLWYQPCQINLAYSAINTMLPRRPRRIQVVDFGAGALAAQFGMALLFADMQEGVTASVHSMDPSDAMMNLGLATYGRFVEELRPRNPRAYEACMGIETIHSAIDGVSIRRIRKAHRVLSAFHAVYPETMDEVAARLQSLRVDLRPRSTVTTTHRTRQGLAKAIAGRLRGDPTDVLPTFEGDLPRVTALRRQIWDAIGRPTGIAEAYLRPNVTWAWADAAIFITRG